MGSSTYDEKRDFESTSEPPGQQVSADVDPLTAPPGGRFVIQQHHATRLHHDVRLEMMNDDTPVLVSWAVPKGLPRRRGERHLAIHVEDHPMEYATFSGSIPRGEYGGGEVRVFDQGGYELVDRNDERLTFRLEGGRLAGIWHLVHTGPKDGKDQWLAIMSEDLRAPGDERPPADPMLAGVTTEAFDDPEWGFEPRWGGIRAIAMCGEETQLISADGRDITVTYPELSRLHDQVVALEAMLDGEIVAFEEGVPSQELLQQRKRLGDDDRIEQEAKRIPVVYMAFDLLWIDGRDLTDRPLRERRRILEEAIVASEQILVSPLAEATGTALAVAATEQGLGGIVAKRLSSRYQPGTRSDDWLELRTEPT